MVNGYESAKVEVHIIAYIYHWGRNEIMNLPINERKMYFNFINEQKRLENSHNDTPN